MSESDDSKHHCSFKPYSCQVSIRMFMKKNKRELSSLKETMVYQTICSCGLIGTPFVTTSVRKADPKERLEEPHD